MPVLMMKGTEGLADRLTFLAHCIHYCRATNTALCVDWTDGIFGGGEVDFGDVFEVTGIKTMKKEQVVKLMATGRMKVHPPCWTLMDVASTVTQKTFDEKYSGDLFHDDSKEPESKIERIDADIIVTNGKGFRCWYGLDLLAHLRVRPEYAERIRVLLSNFERDCLLVHLRGTDRLNEEFNKGAIETAKQFPADYKIYVVTDSLRLFEEFKNAIPKAKLVNPQAECLKITSILKSGTHLVGPEVLKKYGVSKKQLLIDSLVDFFAIILAHDAIGLKESYYFKLARGLAKFPQQFLSSFMGFPVDNPAYIEH